MLLSPNYFVFLGKVKFSAWKKCKDVDILETSNKITNSVHKLSMRRWKWNCYISLQHQVRYSPSPLKWGPGLHCRVWGVQWKNHSFCKNAWATSLFEKKRLHTCRVTKSSQPFTHLMNCSSCLHPELTSDTFSQHTTDHHVWILQTIGGNKIMHFAVRFLQKRPW